MPILHLLLFRSVIITFTLISQYIVYHVLKRYINSMRVNPLKGKRWLPISIAIVNLPLLLLQFLPEFSKSTFARQFIMVPYFAYQTLSIAIILFASIYWFGKMFTYPYRRLKNTRANFSNVKINTSRRLFIKKTAFVAGAYTFIGSAHSIYNRDEYEISKVDLNIRNLPDSLHGLTISMISDIHSGLFMTEEDMDMYVAELNKL
ncbi:MAG: hypothetical protein ACP5US_12750, partial [Candidatus Kryptoniota bacterium]